MERFLEVVSDIRILGRLAQAFDLSVPPQWGTRPCRSRSRVLPRWNEELTLASHQPPPFVHKAKISAKTSEPRLATEPSVLKVTSYLRPHEHRGPRLTRRRPT